VFDRDPDRKILMYFPLISVPTNTIGRLSSYAIRQSNAEYEMQKPKNRGGKDLSQESCSDHPTRAAIFIVLLMTGFVQMTIGYNCSPRNHLARIVALVACNS